MPRHRGRLSATQVEIYPPGNPTPLVFPINAWLPPQHYRNGVEAIGNGNGSEFEVTLEPGIRPRTLQYACRYQVTVNTSDIRGAGTDANVYVTIYGSKGDSGELRLESSWNDFERGRSDKFVVESADVGEIQAVEVRDGGVDGGCCAALRRAALCVLCCGVSLCYVVSYCSGAVLFCSALC